MRQFQTSVLERRHDFTADFETPPFEVAWASEAIFFIRVEEVSGRNVSLDAAVQISADGIRWVNEGSVFPRITGSGDFFLRVRHLGGWLRLSARIGGVDPRFKTTIHLALKE